MDTVTFHRYCLIIASRAIVYVIDNVWIVKIPNYIFDIIQSILLNLIVISFVKKIIIINK
jgi:hypothetical protein